MKKQILIFLLLGFMSKVFCQTITHVTLTCYQPVKSQCNNQPLVTADGSKIDLHHLKEAILSGVQFLVIYSIYFQRISPKKCL